MVRMNANFDLDDRDRILSVDRQGMLAHIDVLPDQLEQAWRLAQTLPLPDTHRRPRQIVLAGMGGSAIGGDLIAALIVSTSPVPLAVVRGYDLPAYVSGPDTLVIASSFSGNTEETLSAVDQALGRGVWLLALSTGGQLAHHAQSHGYPLWQFDYKSQPRAALGWSFGLLVGLAHRLDLAPHLEADLAETVTLLREQKATYTASTPATQNPAKRGAGQLIGRIPVIYGGGIFEPVARRWKCQFNENAKTPASYNVVPEMDHNEIAGWHGLDDFSRQVELIFLCEEEQDERLTKKVEVTAQMLQDRVGGVTMIHVGGNSATEKLFSTMFLGDFVTTYLALLNGVDPVPVDSISELKERMARVESQ
jgi:glucose/mannose-6-phosphate isomerase